MSPRDAGHHEGQKNPSTKTVAEFGVPECAKTENRAATDRSKGSS
jgi:hypothetical protein